MFVQVLTHDGLSRFVMASLSAFLISILLIRRNYIINQLIQFLIMLTLIYFGYYVGWGTYFSVGRDPSDYKSRPGVFDWLVGMGHIKRDFY